MMAVGCIQAQVCHTGKCPVGVATQNPRRARAIDVPDKSERVKNYHDAVVAEAARLMASMGASSPEDLEPTMLRRHVSESDSWAEQWPTARADSVTIPHGHSR